ncbi:synapse-associated protein 1 [Parasteatoda tepidariorum]|uniref:synapse-associated protein 1 n=1 Tax=Parasteatoda tepidariorum TaxID=114398 RepID=UPI00077FA5BE|nr:synapse-associated protein 1 [Parasteatoda tepidariorum]
MDLLWKVSSKAKEILTQKEEASENQGEVKAESSDDFAAGLRSEKPVSSLSLETQQGNSDREASSESEGVISEHSTSPISKESDRNSEGNEDPEKSGVKVGISAGDLKDVSNKAVESAKSFGSFLYGIANKTGRTLTETAKQLKTTVEENSILGDFNKEQEAFVTSKNADAKNESPPPWVGTDNEESVKEQVLSLSADKRNFLRSPPTGVMFDFDFDSMYPIAKTMLKEDPTLEKMRFEIVPKLINEENFWRNYFYRVSLVKQSSRISKMTHQKSSSGDSTPTSPAKSSSEDSIKAGMDKTTADAGGGADSDATDSPNHEFVSDSFQSSKVSAEDIKQGMKMLGVTDKSSKDDDWEKEMQQELQEYEVVAEGNEDDPDWENEIEQMLEGKVKDAV